jgi:hypothetical protein
VDGEDEDVAHRVERTITAGTCKTARRVRVASHCEFATHRFWAACITNICWRPGWRDRVIAEHTIASHWELATHTYSEYAIVHSWHGKSGFSVGGWKRRCWRFRPGSLRDS